MTASVFGLGNRQYEHFNSAGRAVERALSAMGATMLLPIGAPSPQAAVAVPAPPRRQLRGCAFAARAALVAGACQTSHDSAVGSHVSNPLPCAHGSGLGDDDGTLEDDFASWRKALWGALEAKFPRVAGSGDAKARETRASLEEEGKAAPASYAVDVAPKGTPAPAPKAGKAPFSAHNPYLARAVRSAEKKAGERSTRTPRATLIDARRASHHVVSLPPFF